MGHPKYDNDPTLKVRPEQGLLKMRKELGLEAMNEFVDMYVMAVEKANPELRDVLKESLSDRAVDQLYQGVMHQSRRIR